jgi:phage tail-like protein
MTRGTLPDLPSPVALLDLLPGVYRDLDDNIGRFTETFDALLAPAWMVLDNIDAYFDPALAPLDFLHVLAAWVGMPLDGNWREDQARRLVARAVELYRWRGTRRGVSALVEAYTGVVPEVEDSGGTVWSATPGAPAPGVDQPSVRVRVQLPADSDEDLVRLTRLIAENVPAHVAVNVEISRPGA